MCMFMRLLSLPVIILVSALICKLKLDLVKIPHHFGPSFVLRKVYQKVHIDCQSLVFFFSCSLLLLFCGIEYFAWNMQICN
jgi:hypothetical protein